MYYSSIVDHINFLFCCIFLSFIYGSGQTVSVIVGKLSLVVLEGHDRDCDTV